MMLGMGDSVAVRQVDYPMLDAYVAQGQANLSPANLAQAPDSGISEVCKLCADPNGTFDAAFGNAIFAPGMTRETILAHYSSQINAACGAVATEAKKRGLTGPCGAAAASSASILGGVSPVLLIGGALVAAALLMGGKD